MAMNFIDIASYQADLNLDNITFDGVMIKATEGVDYVNPYCDTHFQEAKAKGKKRAIYHFTNFGNPIAEADFFVDNCEGYIHDALFVLDWEGVGVSNVSWALRFMERVESRIGYKPAIYMSEWVENAYDWSTLVANDYGLWLAKYSDYEIDNNYDMSGAGTAPTCVHWPFYFMWQWTSKGRLNGYFGDLDCDIVYLTPEQWDKYAGIIITDDNNATRVVPDVLPVPPAVSGDQPDALPDQLPVPVPQPAPTPPPVTDSPAPVADTPVVPGPVANPVPGTIITPTPVPPTTTVVVKPPINKKKEKNMKNLFKNFTTNEWVVRAFHTFWQAALGVLLAHYLAPGQPTDVKALVVAAVAAGASAVKTMIVTSVKK